MTTREAINYLLDPLSLPESMDIKDKLRWHEDALNMAIEALKAQDAKPDGKADQEHGGSAEFGLKTGETCADAISRQDAIDALNEYFARIGKLKRRGLTKGEKAISLDTVGIIKTLPFAQTEPLTVRDKLNSMTDDEFAEWLCHQIFPNYDGNDEDDIINVVRYKSVMRFLKMDIKQAKEENR